MNDGGSRGRVKLGELIDAAMSPADAAAHAGFVADLAAVTRTADAVGAVADRFFAEGDRGRRVFLEWFSRVRVRVPAPVLELVPPLLADPALPNDLRARAAARALRSTRDPAGFLTRLVPPLTAGLSPQRALARLRDVQGRLRRSKALDRLIARRERRLRLMCPRCAVRLRRSDLARHLFEAHGLLLDAGRARRPERFVKELRKRYKTGRDTTTLDRAAQLATPAALRSWAARTGPKPADIAPLADSAATRGKGVCPHCLAELHPSVAPLPPPLVLSGGRLVGEGCLVEIHGRDGLRTFTVTTPTGLLRSGFDGRRLVGSRTAGVLAATAVIAAGIGLRAPPTAALIIAVCAYAVARYVRSPLPPRGGRAIDRAWTTLAPRSTGDATGPHFLTRLCRASVGRGNPELRAAVLKSIRVRWDETATAASVGYLQLDDSRRLGVDRIAGVAALIATGLNGDKPLAFAESIAELFLTGEVKPSPADRARLRVLVLEAAFAAGIVPRGLAELGAACPRLRELTAAEPITRTGLQYVIWMLRESRPWDSTVVAGTVFELARVAPTLSGRLLADHPDLLLYHRPPPGVDETLGWVLVCARGVVVGGKLIADSDAEVRVDGGRLIGSATLVVGPHQFTLPRRPPVEFVAALRRLLRVRSERLFPHLDAALVPGRIPTQLASLARRCDCGADVLVAAGEMGTAVRRSSA